MLADTSGIDLPVDEDGEQRQRQVLPAVGQGWLPRRRLPRRILPPPKCHTRTGWRPRETRARDSPGRMLSELRPQNGRDHSQPSRSTGCAAPTTRTKASSSDSPPARNSSSVPHVTMRAVIDDGHAVAQALHHFEHVRGQKDGGAAPHLVDQDVLHQPRAHRVHAFERLVHQKQVGMVDQRRRHRDALAHALGVLADDLAVVLQFEQIQQVARRAPWRVARSRPYMRPTNSRNSTPVSRSNSSDSSGTSPMRCLISMSCSGQPQAREFRS